MMTSYVNPSWAKWWIVTPPTTILVADLVIFDNKGFPAWGWDSSHSLQVQEGNWEIRATGWGSAKHLWSILSQDLRTSSTKAVVIFQELGLFLTSGAILSLNWKLDQLCIFYPLAHIPVLKSCAVHFPIGKRLDSWLDWFCSGKQ